MEGLECRLGEMERSRLSLPAQPAAFDGWAGGAEDNEVIITSFKMTESESQRIADCRLAMTCLDLTSLNDGDTPEVIAALCAKAAKEPRPAAVCVESRFVSQWYD